MHSSSPSLLCHNVCCWCSWTTSLPTHSAGVVFVGFTSWTTLLSQHALSQHWLFGFYRQCPSPACSAGVVVVGLTSWTTPLPSMVCHSIGCCLFFLAFSFPFFSCLFVFSFLSLSFFLSFFLVFFLSYLLKKNMFAPYQRFNVF